ncbi:hypothetical protein ADEAN_000792300 [Angomonas deanei]|uniref:Uncharacterized protein n=1 Tax=Angomonas deanei TaxID=59799 RepID=A0A7G2CLV1_9TRYP|nr:hypothetical protein ADEAN_000792300 [Angomonas deanei]
MVSLPQVDITAGEREGLKAIQSDYKESKHSFLSSATKMNSHLENDQDTSNVQESEISLHFDLDGIDNNANTTTNNNKTIFSHLQTTPLSQHMEANDGTSHFNPNNSSSSNTNRTLFFDHNHNHNTNSHVNMNVNAAPFTPGISATTSVPSPSRPFYPTNNNNNNNMNMNSNWVAPPTQKLEEWKSIMNQFKMLSEQQRRREEEDRQKQQQQDNQ